MPLPRAPQVRRGEVDGLSLLPREPGDDRGRPLAEVAGECIGAVLERQAVGANLFQNCQI